MRRRAFLAALATLPAAPAFGAAPDAQRNAEDFDALWRAIDEGYAYFEADRAAWRRARDIGRPKARAARTRAELVLALEAAIAHLCDDSVALGEQVRGSARLVPAETDLWAEWRDGEARVTAVRAFGDADVAGVHPGHVVTHVDGIPVERAVRDRLRALGAAGPAARDWALRHLLAGPRAGTLRLSLRDAGRPAVIEVERGAAPGGNGPPLIARRMGEDRDLGYVRIRNVLADPAVTARFDAALHYLKDTRALILDLRDTAEGGSRAVSEAILARFVERETPWQVREGPGRVRNTDLVKPHATPYRAGLVVLVDRWTAGEAEALAAGLDGAARATLVGTPMAGLRGEPREVKLPHSGIALRFPAQKALHVDGTPRELLHPGVEVDLAAPSGGPGDPILYQGLKAASSAPAGRSARR